MKNMINYIKESAFSFLFSDLCHLCKDAHATESKLICPECEERLKFIRDPMCVVCGRPFFAEGDISHTCGECLKEKRHFEKARSIFIYDDLVRQKIIDYKFFRNVTLAAAFREFMLDYIECELDGAYDLILPVPLHKKRLRERYFNQAMLLVKGSEKRNQIRVDKYSLKRIRYTKPQVLVKNKERADNVKGAFIVNNDYIVKEKRVLLVDDIYTTGATVNECAKVLKTAGAYSVDVLTLAKTVIF